MARTGILLALRGATLAYGAKTVLTGVDLAVTTGDYLGLVGPNGSGKTTLLRALLGALEPRDGTYERDPSLEGIGYVPQRHGLNPFFPVTAADIVLMGRFGRLAVGRRPGAADRDAVRRALEAVGVADLSGRLYRELSGGQQQRILIARALACESELLVLDEPTSGMDLPSEAEIMSLLDGLREARGLAVVLVTHELNLVADHAERIALIREGRLLVGPTAEILSARCLGEAYGVPVEVLAVGGSSFVRVAPCGMGEAGSSPDPVGEGGQGEPSEGGASRPEER